MTLTLGFSPCPNDTFIFDALVNQKIDTQGLDFDVRLEDVQTLNEWARQGKLDVSKISYGVLPLVLKDYQVLPAGGALGKGVGPLLIAKAGTGGFTENITEKTIAIPGVNTTAHLLFSLAFPAALKKEFMLFSEIENAILQGKVDAGVIIHENRFTYQQKGLVKLMELGEFWEEKTGAPIPLGGIIIKRQIDPVLGQKVNDLIHASLQYSFARYPFISDYIKCHSQEMEESVMRQHIDLYVNNFSLDLGPEGKKAVLTLLDVYGQINQVPAPAGPVFLD